MSVLVNHVRRHPVSWIVLVLGFIPFVVLNAQGLGGLEFWFMPDRFFDLFDSLSLWRLWTPVFVHYTLLHLLTNLYLWWLFATQIESISRVQLLWLFVIMAPVSNLAQWWFTGPRFGGLSGVVYALLGFIWVMQARDPQRGYHVDRGLAIVMLLLIPLAMTGKFGNYSDYAHVVGLIGGAGVGWVQSKRHLTNEI